ncbi:hypothetical protein SEA_SCOOBYDOOBYDOO_96 [Mycobacterium phage ScoobyDoobyDoo]|nr:hypothetical protein SEA_SCOOBYDOOBYDOO_96 [Mycobacterium phage ScoobyDoobyDoo]
MYKMNGKLYTEDEIREALRPEVAEIEATYRENGAENPHVDLDEYLAASLNTGTIERVEDL